MEQNKRQSGTLKRLDVLEREGFVRSFDRSIDRTVFGKTRPTESFPVGWFGLGWFLFIFLKRAHLGAMVFFVLLLTSNRAPGALMVVSGPCNTMSL